MTRRDGIIALVCLALLAAGCRPAQSDRATEATHAFLDGLARGDGAAACERLSEEGVSELLLIGLEHRVAVEAADVAAADTCARIAGRLPAQGAAALLRSPVTRVILHGDRATVETHAGAYELREHDGDWLLSRFEPVRAAIGAPATPGRAVTLTVVAPKELRPSLGSTVAAETADAELELSGVLSPPDAHLAVHAVAGGAVAEAEARDGRFRVRLELEPGENVFELMATGAGREPAQLSVRVTRR